MSRFLTVNSEIQEAHLLAYIESIEQFGIFGPGVCNVVNEYAIVDHTVDGDMLFTDYHTVALLIKPFIRSCGTGIRKAFKTLQTIQDMAAYSDSNFRIKLYRIVILDFF